MIRPEIQEYLEMEAASDKPPRSALTMEQTRQPAMRGNSLLKTISG